MATIKFAPGEGALTISIPATAERLGIGLSTAKLLIAKGEIQSIRIGRRRLVVADSVREYIMRLANNGSRA